MVVNNDIADEVHIIRKSPRKMKLYEKVHFSSSFYKKNVENNKKKYDKKDCEMK